VQSIITTASTLHTHCASTWCQDRITYNHQSLILIFAVHIAHLKAALITATVQATTSTSQTRHSNITPLFPTLLTSPPRHPRPTSKDHLLDSAQLDAIIARHRTHSTLSTVL
jgi:hypothetical protein